MVPYKPTLEFNIWSIIPVSIKTDIKWGMYVTIYNIFQ